MIPSRMSLGALWAAVLLSSSCANEQGLDEEVAYSQAQALNAFGVNLIANASFATASSTPSIPLGWKKGGFGTNDRTYSYPVAGYDGSPGAQVAMTTRSSGDAKWYFTPIAVSAGETYRYSDYFTSNTTSTVTAQFALADGSLKFQDLAVGVPAAAGWTQLTRTFVVPTYPSPVVSVTVYHLINSVGSLTTDTTELVLMDVTPPTVTLDALPSGQVSGIVPWSATAADNVGVSNVQLYVDGLAVGAADGSAPYGGDLDTTTLTNGLHTVTARATDAAGNSTTSSAASLNVWNGSGAPENGSLTIHLQIINDNGGSATVANFPVFYNSTNAVVDAATPVPPGIYTVSEILPAGYTMSFSGDCSASGIVTINPAQSSACTIINDDFRAELDPPPTNVVTNPSVETAASPTMPVGWVKGGWGTNTRTLTYPVAGHSGTRAMRAEITSYTSGDAKWYFNSVTALAGESYTFSTYYRSNRASSVTAQVLLQNGTYKYIDLNLAVPAASDWTLFSKLFTIPTNLPSPPVSMTVFHLIAGVGYLDTDDVTVTPLDTRVYTPGNDVPNPGFEFASDTPPSPTLWHTSVSPGTTASFAYPVPGRTGNAARIDVSEYTSGAGAKWYFQSVPVVAGNDYEFIDYYQSTMNTSVPVQFTMADGTYTYFTLANLAPSATWKQLRATFTVPSNATRATVLHTTRGVGSLTIDDVSLRSLGVGAFARGMVSLNFDDGPITVYNNAIPILFFAGIRSNQYIVTRYFGDPSYVSQAEVLLMSLGGHEIGSHSQNHPHLLSLTSAEARAEIAGSRTDLQVMGITPQTFVYPFGEYDDVVRQMVIDAGYRGARSVRVGFNTPNGDPYALLDQHVESTTTIGNIRGWIDYAVANRKWLILELHDIDNTGMQYSATPTVLQQTVDYIRSSGIQVVTTAEGLTAMGH
jgi:peptidoglycan/xylan/chitin deacetylase (PgdA/CDA1 family)